MEASLSGSAFKVNALSKAKQAVADTGFTTWQWQIQPLDWGKQSLYVNVCIIFQPKGREAVPRCARAYTREVAVSVAPVYAATHFVKNNVTWTLSLIFGTAIISGGGIVGLIIRFVKKLRTKRRMGFQPPQTEG